MKIIDAHSHINYITHLHQSDVVGTVCCAIDENQWAKLLDLMRQHKNIYGAFGIHPWFIDSVFDDFENRLFKLLQSDSFYMIGEIGLDKYKPDMDKQLDVFIKQFDLAVKLKRTVFLHCVGAWDKILHVLKQYKLSDLPIIVAHGFNEKENILQNLLRYDNIYFSVNKIGVYGGKCRIDQIPNNKILVETDGKSDVNMKNLVNQISQVKNESDIDKIIFNNTQKVISNGQIK